MAVLLRVPQISVVGFGCSHIALAYKQSGFSLAHYRTIRSVHLHALVHEYGLEHMLFCLVERIS